MKEVKNNKIKKILLGTISLILIIGASILIFERFNHEEKTLTDAKKFAKEYKSTTEENLYTYVSASEIIKILESKTGVIFFGYPECKWCQAYAPILNEVALEENVDKIYYFNIKEERDKKSSNYQKITNILEEYLYYDDEGNHKLYVPDVIIVKNGKIIGHNNEGALVTKQNGSPEEYFNEEQKENLKNTLRTYLKELKDN